MIFDTSSKPGNIYSNSVIGKRLERIWRQREVELECDLSYRKVLEQLNNLYGLDASPTYLNNLRRGISDNPTINVLIGLAQYFSVPIEYFVTSDEKYAEQLLMHHNVEQDPTIVEMVNLVAYFSPEKRIRILNVIRFLLNQLYSGWI